MTTPNRPKRLSPGQLMREVREGRLVVSEAAPGSAPNLAGAEGVLSSQAPTEPTTFAEALAAAQESFMKVAALAEGEEQESAVASITAVLEDVAGVE